MAENWALTIFTCKNCKFESKLSHRPLGNCSFDINQFNIMSTRKFILNSSRSSKQGTLINVGKDSEEYQNLTSSMTMEPGDMAEIGLSEGQMALIRTEFGEAEFRCQSGKVPEGMIFIPYGPPTCRLMGGDTGGTGMPISKGWEVEVVPL